MVCGAASAAGDLQKKTLGEYLHGKQTIAQISETTGLSASTVTRRLASISFSWEQPRIKGSGVIHLDATILGAIQECCWLWKAEAADFFT